MLVMLLRPGQPPHAQPSRVRSITARRLHLKGTMLLSLVSNICAQTCSQVLIWLLRLLGLKPQVTQLNNAVRMNRLILSQV